MLTKNAQCIQKQFHVTGANFREKLATASLIKNLKRFLENIQEFVEQFAGKLEIKCCRFVKYVAKWRKNRFKETRGR